MVEVNNWVGKKEKLFRISHTDSMGDTKASAKPIIGEHEGAKAMDNKGEDKDSTKPSMNDEENNLAQSIDDLFGDVERIAEASPPKKLPVDRPVNPVYEMEMKARKNEQQGEDGPPFNFQGMLRKTHYCRGSLKRSDDYGQSNSYNAFNERGGPNYTNNNSGFGRIDNGPVNSHKPSRPRRNSDKWKQQDDANVHQLAPGIVLEGQEEEL